ncbi:MAG: hypothetical protein EOM25_08015, partial [Deltaproteobacteria bacterium]|nr:hypothetical protein [Deltaproteobacteria bacterium]
GLRSRTLEGKVWRLGDIVHSTPVSVGQPVENYHVIYSSESYLNYLRLFGNRETMVYVGANDGMLHAFTSWQYNSTSKQFSKPVSAPSSERIGDEIWAYIPQTLLPHLKWLADPEYTHVYYVDERPRVFDAQILPDGTHYSDPASGKNWGTFLLCGLRMGGKHIWAEGDFGSGNEIRNFDPVYFLMDVTDPRNPRLMWERSYGKMGLSMSRPSIVKGKDSWFAVFGSGPMTYDGASSQNGYVFVVDLVTGNPVSGGAGDWLFDTGQKNAFMGASAALDKNLNFCVDTVYIGETYAQGGSWNGNLYKIAIPALNGGNFDPSDPSFYESDPTKWKFSKVFAAGQPITAAPSISVDSVDNVWVYFGTGRFYSLLDKASTATEYFYGIKDPFYNPAHKSGGFLGGDYYQNYSKNLILDAGDLLDSDPFEVRAATARVYQGTQLFGTGSYQDFILYSRQFDGWKLTMQELGERVLEKPSIIGGTVLFVSYVPNDDVCGFGGESNFYGVYYETGAAYTKDILYSQSTRKLDVDGLKDELVFDRKISIGSGKASGISIHAGQQDGATANVQMSTGDVLQIDIDPALSFKSRLIYWKELDREN